jgi:glycosyltransferase involved in cell wall biosynthesis
VLRQDYPDIEYLVQDAASTDGTVEILRKYEDGIRICSEPDRGPIDAFHKALARSTGDILCMLLSDERFADDAVVSRAVGALRRNPDAGAIYGDFRVVDTGYREIRIEQKEPITFEELFCFDAFISPCAAFVRTEALKQNGRPNPDLRSFFDDIGDYGLWVYVGARFPLRYVPGVMADFMVHSGEVSYGLKHCQAYIRECEVAIECFRSDAYTPSQIAALKNRALARLYLNYGNILAGTHRSESLALVWKGVRRRPQLLLTKTFLAAVAKSAGFASWLPARADGRRVKQPRT